MTVKEVMTELEKLGTESTKKTWMRHGAKGAYFGVKIQDLKVLQKKIKADHKLALELYKTGNSDAMYLAGLISEPMKMTKKELNEWAEGATWSMISDYTVPWTASESPYALELASEWIKSPSELIACSGWATYASYLGITPDEKIDKKLFSQLLSQVEKKISTAPNKVRYAMNNFIISCGGYFPELTKAAKETADKIGTVTVDMGDTSCKVPSARAYIEKMEAKKVIGKKRKTAKC